MSAEQAAQAAAAAAASTPQQQPQGTPQQSVATPASVSNSGDQLVCQWQSCGERLPSAEQLYVSTGLRLYTGCVIPSSREHAIRSRIASGSTLPNTSGRLTTRRITFANVTLGARAPTT